MRKVCGSRAKVGPPGDQQREEDSDVPLVVIKQELAKESSVARLLIFLQDFEIYSLLKIELTRLALNLNWG